MEQTTLRMSELKLMGAKHSAYFKQTDKISGKYKKA